MLIDYIDVDEISMSQLKWIETQRLILNDLKHEDTEAIFSIFSNDAVLEFYDVKKFTSVHQAYDLIDKMHERFRNRQGYRYAIRLKCGKLIGSFGVNRLIQIEGQHGVVIGYDLHPDFWQQGYMSEVLSQMLLDLKENLLFTQKISFVVAEVYAENDKSIQLLVKYGFQQVEINISEHSCFNVDMTSRLIFKLLLE